MTTDTHISPKEAAIAARRYSQLKSVRYVTADGEILSADELKRETEYLNALLKRAIEEHGPLDVEGVGLLKIQERSGGMAYDLEALYAHDLPTFVRMLEKGCLSVNAKVLAEQVKAGNIATAPKGMALAGTPALIIERPR